MDVRTTKPISTISFNTVSYLKLKLDEMTRNHILSFWCFISHKPEDDEAGLKEHIHLYVEPSRLLQTDDLRTEFLEPDPEKDKPRGCLVFRSSKFDDWYLYALHRREYLASKGQARKFHYKHEDIVSSDSDDLLFKAKSIDMLSVSPYAAMAEAQSLGMTWSEFFSQGLVPLPQVRQFEYAWNLMLENATERNGRKGHIDVVARPDTGEVLGTLRETEVDEPVFD